MTASNGGNSDPPNKRTTSRMPKEMDDKFRVMWDWIRQQCREIEKQYSFLMGLHEEICGIWRMFTTDCTKCRTDFLRLQNWQQHNPAFRYWMIDERIKSNLQTGRKLYRRLKLKIHMTTKFHDRFVKQVRKFFIECRIKEAQGEKDSKTDEK